MKFEMDVKINGETPVVRRKCLSWKKRTLLERYLIGTCLALFVAFLSMMAALLYLEIAHFKPRICKTSLCNRIAGRMMSVMDLDVDPCEDFYKFACGSFHKVMPAPNQINQYDFYEIVKENMLQFAEGLLTTEVGQGDPDFVKKSRRYYEACLNLDTETSVLIKELLNISEIYRWPILENENYDEDQLFVKARALVEANGGSGAFFKIYYTRNNTVPHLVFEPETVFGGEEMFLNSTEESCVSRKKRYRALLISSFLKAGAKPGAIESEVDALIQFQTLLANVSNVSSNSEEKEPTETTLKDLSQECREVGLLDAVRYFYEYLGRSDGYDDESTVTLFSKTYFDNICNLFRSSSRRIIYNYLVWRFLAEKLQEFDPRFKRDYLDITGRDAEEPETLSKSRACIRNLKSTIFVSGLNYLAIRRLDADKSTEEVRVYDEHIREVMDHMFSTETWLDDEGKKLAREILANISAEIGYSKASLDSGLFEEIFSQVNVSDSHIENSLSNERRKLQIMLFNDTFPVDLDIKIGDPLSIHAFFMGSYYALNLAFMQLPFYEYGAPKYINCAVIPLVIAHEFLHAYDALDFQHPLYNNTTDDEINWSAEVVDAYKERKECYVNQYSQYPIDDNGTMVNGSNTFGDNMADCEGVIQAFTAYEKYYLSQSEEPGLPGLGFTNAELFFIQFAQSWCGTVKDPVKEYKNDVHSPARYRVIGPLQNFPRFAEVFSCPLGSPMNPEDKCRMWI